MNNTDWIDKNNIVIYIYTNNGHYYINKIDLVNRTSENIFTATDEIENIYGLNVSATGQYLISHVWMKTGGNKILAVRL